MRVPHRRASMHRPRGCLDGLDGFHGLRSVRLDGFYGLRGVRLDDLRLDDLRLDDLRFSRLSGRLHDRRSLGLGGRGLGLLLRLLRNLRLLRPLLGRLERSRWALLHELVPDPDLVHQVPNLVRRLGPDTQPVQRAVLVDLDHARIVERVVFADVLDEAAVAGTPLVRHHDAEERALVGTHPSQPDPRRHVPCPLAIASAPEAWTASPEGPSRRPSSSASSSSRPRSP